MYPCPGTISINGKRRCVNLMKHNKDKENIILAVYLLDYSLLNWTTWRRTHGTRLGPTTNLACPPLKDPGHPHPLLMSSKLL